MFCDLPIQVGRIDTKAEVIGMYTVIIKIGVSGNHFPTADNPNRGKAAACLADQVFQLICGDPPILPPFYSNRRATRV